MTKRRPKPKPRREPDAVISIVSDLAPDGRTYVATIHLDGDTARTLNRDQGIAWASTVLTAAAQAEHDALVIRQLAGKVGMALDLACVGDLRADRPPLDDAATAPLRLEPGVNAKMEPFLALYINGEQMGQWTCQDAREHATGILEVMAAVDLDAAYYRFLTGSVKVDPPEARGIVGLLAEDGAHA
ncbi:hypothetical protein [Streptacidiphilus carbonis]|uniref:hypothetical protein n=1 Tax=Streptacidiphilus carbonis TaxID=105422 RepID=UPI0005AB861B|nr:hypothetical protein [Streptacidiphilus carbonis]